MTLNVSKCLADAVQAGRLTAAQARGAEQRVEQLVAKGLPEAEAVARAAQEIGAEAARKQRQTALRIIATQRNLAQAESHPGGFFQGVAALLARDIRVRAGYSNVEGRAQAIVAEAHARLAHLLDAYRTKNLGFKQDLPGLRRFVRALYGEQGDQAASGFARAWTETTDALVDRFNLAGGALANRADWRLPQLWNRDAVKAAGQGEFTAFMNAELESGGLRIRDPDTGEAVAPERAAAIIAKAFERIQSNGVVDLVPGQPGGTALANSRMDSRAFEWTSADAWFRFNDRFGEGDGAIYDMLVGHVDGLARDIAQLEILGPNPAQMVRFLTDSARQKGASATQVRILENLWNTVNGHQASPVSEFWANTMQGIRSWLTSVQLGSAVLSSVTDFATIRQAAAWNGLPTTDVMRRYVGLLNPANAEDRIKAVRLGLIAEGWTTRAMGAMRHQADIVGRDLAARVADTVMRASGMSAHTQAAKWAFGMEFSAHLADRVGKTLAELEPELRQSFARYGITAEDWDVIRARGLWEEEGVRFILPEQIVQGAPRVDAAPQLPDDIAAWKPGAALPADLAAGNARAAELAKTPTEADQSAARRDLRAQVVATVMQRRLAEIGGAPAMERKALIVIGPPSAGKSSIIEPLARDRRALLIDADDLKEQLPEFNGGLGAMRVHEESSQMARFMRDQAIEAGLNIAIPTVGDNPVKLRATIEQLRRQGYSVTLVLNDLPIEKAAQRNMLRFRETGRLVAHDYLMSIASKPKEAYTQLRSIADEHAHYSNDVPRGHSPLLREGRGLLRTDPSGTEKPAAGRPRAGAAEPVPGENAGPLAPAQSGGVSPEQTTAQIRAASRLLEMIQGETRFAVVEPGALERSIMLGSSRPGTLGGEFRRATAQYKSFPVAMMTRHLARAYDSLRAGDHGAYLATLAIGLTTMGALAMQMKEIAMGRDPRDMNTPSFWGAAFMQGGGAGILGDFLYTGLTRADRGFYMTAIGGPTAGLVDDLVRLTGGNIQGLAEDKDTHFGRELARFAQRNTPGTSLWYSRLAVDRLMWERLQEMLDPQAPRRWRELERRRMQDYDQEFWWRPGTSAPQRGPEIFRGD